MPRNVRPSWVRVSSDHSSNGPVPASVGKGGHGPRGRSGTLVARFLSRIDGSPVDFLEVSAIGSADGDSVVWTVTDKRTGAVVFSETVQQ